MTAAVRHGLIGEISSVAFLLHFDHSWTAGTRFDDDANLLLFDFGIHWIDLVHRLFQPRSAQRVYARVTRSGAQTPKPPLVGEVICEFERGLASITFNGDTRFGQRDETTIVGANGSLSSRGPNLSSQTVELVARDGTCRVPLEGTWFENGFHGAMAELQSAVAEHRQPEHGASDNLETLKLAFAIVESARRAEPIVPGTIRFL
jgi:predicted dehydrogenase